MTHLTCSSKICITNSFFFFAGRRRLLLWWEAVGPEHIVHRLGVHWREDETSPVESTKVTAVLIEGDSLSEEGMKQRREHLLSEASYKVQACQLAIIDPPFGLKKHEKAAAGSGNWDDKPWTDDDLKCCVMAMKNSGFLHSDHILMLYHEAKLTETYWNALSSLGYRHHQLITFVKPGQAR